MPVRIGKIRYTARKLNQTTIGCRMDTSVARKHQRYRFLDRLLFARRPERDRHRVSVLQSRHRSRADHRGDGASPPARRDDAENRALPAREHRRAHGRAATRWSPDAARACWCMSMSAPPTRRTAMHNLFRSRLPVLLMAGKAPYTTARRTGRHARHPCAFRAGAVRSGKPGAALYEMGVDAAFRRCRQGGAATRFIRSCRASRAVRSI